MSEQSKKFCVDCSSYKRRVKTVNGRRYDQCGRVQTVIDVVHGKTETEYRSCFLERAYVGEQFCGPEGKFYKEQFHGW